MEEYLHIEGLPPAPDFVFECEQLRTLIDMRVSILREYDSIPDAGNVHLDLLAERVGVTVTHRGGTTSSYRFTDAQQAITVTVAGGEGGDVVYIIQDDEAGAGWLSQLHVALFRLSSAAYRAQQSH